MKICPKCKSQMSDDAKFCKVCGTQVVIKRVCPSCGADLKEDAMFCTECGTKVGDVVETMKPKTRKQTKTVLWSVLIIAIVLVCALVAYLFLSNHRRGDVEIVAPQGSTYTAEELSQLKNDIISKLENSPVIETIQYITLKKDYTVDVDDGFGNIFNFPKGTLLCNNCQDWEMYYDGDEKVYVLTQRANEDDSGDRIPESDVEKNEIAVGSLDFSILDYAVLHFTDDNNEQCEIFKLDENGRVLTYNHEIRFIYGFEITAREVYCIKTNRDQYNYVYLLNEEYQESDDQGYDGRGIGAIGCIESTSIDLNNRLKEDTMVSRPWNSNSASFIYFIPEEKAIFFDGKKYYLSKIELLPRAE